MSLATTPRRCAGPSSHLSSTSLPSLSRRSRVTCAATSAPPSRPTAKDVALAYYTNYNNKNIPGVLELIADDCVYEDLVYQEPFRGKREVAAYFERLGAMLPPDIKFVVEDITEGDPMRVGVRWHVELDDGIVFPFSRGASFYEINDAGQIVFARDIVEPTIKPGSAALQALSLLAPVIRKLGPAADPANLNKLPIAAGAMFALWGGYLSFVMLSTAAPGSPVWATPPSAIQEVLHESYNFFYVNIALAAAGLNPVPCVAEHPVSEAVFNFVNAWSMMLLPAMAVDPRGKKVDSKLGIWVGTMFLTNVFFPVYMALRLLPENAEQDNTGTMTSSTGRSGAPSTTSCSPSVQLPWYAQPVGVVAGVVGVTSLFWALAARPDLAGGLAERWAYATDHVANDRVFFAFVLDAGLYSVWQAVLLGAAGACPLHRFVPFFGAVLWLVKGNGGQEAVYGEE